jgi:hypothetical protein
MAHEEQWVGINVQWDGFNIYVKHSDMDVRQLTNLLYGALLEIPYCLEAMQLAIEKTKPKEMDRTIFNYNLKLLRHSRQLSTTDLADELNFDYTRIRIIENNPKVIVRPEEVEQIAQYFMVDARELTTVKAAITFKTSEDGKENSKESQ